VAHPTKILGGPWPTRPTLQRPPCAHYNECDECLLFLDEFEAMEGSLTSSRCAIVVLCPTFVDAYNETQFHLEHLIAIIDIIYIFRDGLDVDTVTREGSRLRPAIKASIRNSRCLTWSWPIDDNAELGPRDKLSIAQFWLHLKLAIPNHRRRIVVADFDPPAAAAATATATTPGQPSPDIDSGADVFLIRTA